MSRGSTVNALVNVLHSTGRDAAACFFQSPNERASDQEYVWVNTDIAKTDTVATCEIKNLGGAVFSASSAAVLCLTVEAAQENHSFPTLCVVCLATASQRLDSIAAREVVLKEWQLDETAEGRRREARRLLIPMRTIYNVASVVSTDRLSELTRIFLTLRFLGCVDNSQRHRIAAVRLTYILAGPAPTSALNSVLRREEKEEDEIVYVDQEDSESDNAAGSTPPPPPCREGTVPRSTEMAAGGLDGGRRAGSTTVIDVSEGEEEEGAGRVAVYPTPVRGTVATTVGAALPDRGPIPVPSPLSSVTTTETNSSDRTRGLTATTFPMRPAGGTQQQQRLPPSQWITNVDLDGFTRVAGNDTGTAGEHRCQSMMPREHVLSLHEQLKHRTFGPTTAAHDATTNATTATPSTVSFPNAGGSTEGTGADALARAAALLGTSRQALWERASSGSRDGGSRGSSRASSRDPTGPGSVRGSASYPVPLAEDYTWASAFHSDVSRPTQGRGYNDRYGGRTERSRDVRGVSTSTQTDVWNTYSTCNSSSSSNGSRPWQTSVRSGLHTSGWGNTTIASHDEAGPSTAHTRPRMREPHPPVGRFPVKVTFLRRYVDPARQTASGRVREREHGGRVWRCTAVPREPVSDTGVRNALVTSPSSASAEAAPRTTSPFVPAVKLREKRATVSTANSSAALSDVSTQYNRGATRKKTVAPESSAEAFPAPVFMDAGATPREPRHTRAAPAALIHDRARTEKEQPLHFRSPLSHRRSLFPNATPAGGLEETPMGTADEFSPTAAFLATPVRDGLEAAVKQSQGTSAHRSPVAALPYVTGPASHRDHGSPPHTPVMQVASTQPSAAAGQPVASRDTYWILTDPRPARRAEDDGEVHPRPPQLAPPPQQEHSLHAWGKSISAVGADGDGAALRKRSNRQSRHTRMNKGGPGTRGSSPDTANATESPSVQPPPLPLQESPAGRQAYAAGSVLCSSSFLALKHHASRSGTGRRILTLQRGPSSKADTVGNVAHTKGLCTTVSLRKVRGNGSFGGSSGGGGSFTRGECRVEIGAGDSLEALSGILAYYSGDIHQRHVRSPACCFVLRCNGQLVAAVELESEEDVRLAKAVLTASLA